MNVHIIEPATDLKWDTWIARIARPSFFHCSAWLKVLQESYAYRILAFVGEEKGSPLVAVPIVEINSWLTGKRGVCLPFSDFCYPLCAGDNSSLETIIEGIHEYGLERRWDYFEVRGGDCGCEKGVNSIYLHHILDLEKSEQQLFENLSQNTKRNVRKCLGSNVRIVSTISESGLKAFYKLHTRNRKRHGLPVQPYSFFQSIRKNVLESNCGHLLEAIYNEKVISSHLYCYFGGSLIYKYGASDPDYLGLRPNHGIVWEAIRWALARGYKELSFGRSGLHDAGLVRFKEGWGARREELRYWRIGLRKSVSGSSTRKESSSILAMMPVCIVRLAGEMLYRHFG